MLSSKQQAFRQPIRYSQQLSEFEQSSHQDVATSAMIMSFGIEHPNVTSVDEEESESFVLGYN